MSGDEGSLRDIRTALARIARRLDEIGGASPASDAGQPVGEFLDEAARAGLAGLRGLLAIRPGLAVDQALVLALDRILHGAGADCAALFVPNPEGRLAALLVAGFPLARPDAGGEGGVVGRAYQEREPIRGGTATPRPDAFARAHALAHTVAMPVPGVDGEPAGVLVAGRRRPVPFDGAALEILALVADRIGLVLGWARAGHEGSLATAGLGADLDLDRVAATVVRAAAGRLGGSAAALLLLDADGLVLAAGEGLPPGRGRLAVTGALAVVLDRRTAWQAGPGEVDQTLSDLLGAPPRLALPLVVGEQLVGVLVAGGGEPLAAAGLGAFLVEAATAIRNARLYRDAVDALAEAQASRVPAAVPAPAHDFGSLLAVVLGRLAVVRDRVRDTALARELDVAEEAAWRAAEAVRGLLGFAPGQRGTVLTPLDLTAVIRDTVTQSEGRWATREPKPPAVKLDLEAVPPVRGSAEDLREALDHLLENAVESGHGEGPITIRARWDGGGRVEVAVEDHGTGMDEATRRRALEPFFTTKEPGRLGLGLPVAQAIVARHHGELEVASAPGLGTTVRIVLPTVASGRRLGSGAPAAPARVLLVEDEEPVREALVAALVQQGHLVHVAADGRAAVLILEREPIDAVVTDLALPGMSGLEVARTAKRIRPGTAVILVTGWPGGPDPAALAESGVDAVIEKPVGLSEFRAALSVALTRRAARPA